MQRYANFSAQELFVNPFFGGKILKKARSTIAQDHFKKMTWKAKYRETRGGSRILQYHKYLKPGFKIPSRWFCVLAHSHIIRQNTPSKPDEVL